MSAYILSGFALFDQILLFCKCIELIYLVA